jgi:hypothetical protein
MSKIDEYRSQLRELQGDWEPFLARMSGLPGPRGNLELVQAVADEGDRGQFERWARSDDEFLAVCGAVGLGRLLAEGARDVLVPLRKLASDPRWRAREGVAMALQRWGRADMPSLLKKMRMWARGSAFEQRAVAAGLCEPALLRDREHVCDVLALLRDITASVEEHRDRRSEGFVALRKGLAYCWSVAVVASPDDGRPVFELLLSSEDPDVRWLVRQNLKKSRLARMDPDWVERCRNAST